MLPFDFVEMWILYANASPHLVFILSCLHHFAPVFTQFYFIDSSRARFWSFAHQSRWCPAFVGLVYFLTFCFIRPSAMGPLRHLELRKEGQIWLLVPRQEERMNEVEISAASSRISSRPLSRVDVALSISRLHSRSQYMGKRLCGGHNNAANRFPDIPPVPSDNPCVAHPTCPRSRSHMSTVRFEPANPLVHRLWWRSLSTPPDGCGHGTLGALAFAIDGSTVCLALCDGWTSIAPGWRQAGQRGDRKRRSNVSVVSGWRVRGGCESLARLEQRVVLVVRRGACWVFVWDVVGG